MLSCRTFLTATVPPNSWGILVLFLLVPLNGGRLAADEIRFSRDVLPLLSDRCFHCHGPDESNRQADLRFDQRESVFANRDGYRIISPGKPEASELMARITSDDPDVMMPPPGSHRRALTVEQISIMREWIASGAQWGQHWAFEAPRRPAPPNPSLHPVDAFVRQRLAQHQLSPSPRADRHTLLRRLSFDLTGLPPTPDEVQEFLRDESPQAWERQVDRLLTSERYGERMAMWWLDAARYSDTDGYQQDATRTNWPWRDWVVQAFNSNMPFDEFTIKQFAGDLLPEATPDDILATCFHRNHMTNGEGGRDPEESRIDYVIDRVNTTGTVWLGLTLGCCQCHSHKFDPISQRDYYSLFAFFNSIDEDGKAGGGAKPFLKYKSPLAENAVRQAQQVVDRREQIQQAVLRDATREFTEWLEQQIQFTRGGFQPWHVLQASQLEAVEGTTLTQIADGTIQASGANPRQEDYRLVASTRLSRVTGLKLEVLPHSSHTEGKLSRGASGEFILTDIKLFVRRKGQSQLREVEFQSALADAEKPAKGRAYGQVKDTLDDDPRNGWTTETHDPLAAHFAVYALEQPLVLEIDEELVFLMLHRSTIGNANIGRFRVSVTDQRGTAVTSLDPMPLEQLAQAQPKQAADVDDALRDRLLQQFLEDHQAYQQAHRELEQAQRQRDRFNKAAGTLNVMVLSERQEPRSTHVLQRGVWNKPGEAVSRGFPAAILRRSPQPDRTRLELARWLVSRENPLTARVIVNQLWQMCFGAGLVRTPEDFGLQGEFPTHPDLLDYLAVELMEHDWDLHHVLRLIVTSETYRQSSQMSAETLERDPENRWLARASRFRLPSWMIRDAALHSSGLLNTELGGPPVMPYQPPGVWKEMFMGRFTYEPSQGSAQFRRTLYAFWRRSAAPTFLFDSAQRRVCEVRPRRTNTPLHALTLLNDLSLREAARALAREALTRHDSQRRQLDWIFTRVLSRPPSQREVQVLLRELQAASRHYRQSPQDARRMLEFGQPEQRGGERPQHLAALSVVAGMVLNLDEAITHE